jgi:hexosaminidase
MDAVVDLQRPTMLHSVDARFLQESGAWILLPRSVSVAVSDDGTHWKTLQTLPLSPDPNDTHTSIHDVEYTPAEPVRTRYLRLTATRYGKPVAGLQPWLFCDEIVVR